jgi:parallel beta-helix repeat protein
MRKPSLLALIAVWSTALGACGRDAVGPSRVGPRPAALSASRSTAGKTLVVGVDRADCRDAAFTSIQAAVAAAAPGDKIVVCAGTYHEQVTVSKNNLVIVADDEPGGVVVDAHGHDFGFRVLDASGVTIEGFRVEHGHEADIFLNGATLTTIRENVTTAAGHDGIELVASNDNVIEHNTAVDNLADNACGVNVAGGSKRNVVRDNRLVNNQWGIQIVGAATLDNVISENRAVRNRGNGIRNIGGASRTIIEENRAFGNGFAPSALTGATAAGVRIGSGAGIVVRENRAFDNLLVDLRKDAAATATFEDNRCRTSSPPGLCELHEDDADSNS